MAHGGDSSLFINRELSWLAFNERVLEEAVDPSTPLLERVKFAAIAASNLDEFFMVRVAGLKHAATSGDTSVDPAGLTASQQLAAVSVRCHRFVSTLYDLTTRELLPMLATHRIRIASIGDVADRAAVTGFFRSAVLPVLTPLAIDRARPFPLLASLSLNLAVVLSPAPDETDRRLAIVQVPAGLARLVQVHGGDGYTFVLLEEIICCAPGGTLPRAADSRIERVPPCPRRRAGTGRGGWPDASRSSRA